MLMRPTLRARYPRAQSGAAIPICSPHSRAEFALIFTDHCREIVFGAQAEQAAEMVGMGLRFEQVIIVALTDFRDNLGELFRADWVGKMRAATMRAEAQIIVKLISPVDCCVRWLHG
jgi:hypothetical protein